MKTLLKKLLKGRSSRWGLLAVVAVAGSLCVAGMGHKHYQLGGGFVGTSPGLVWNAVQTPLDPAGRTAALLVRTLDDDGSLAGLISAFGGDTGSEGVGEVQMISRDTAKLTMVAYAQLTGVTPKIMAIFVYTGTVQFTDPDNIVLNYTIYVYPASTDANHDGFPDKGATPAVTIPGVTGAGKRVPIL